MYIVCATSLCEHTHALSKVQWKAFSDVVEKNFWVSEQLNKNSIYNEK